MLERLFRKQDSPSSSLGPAGEDKPGPANLKYRPTLSGYSFIFVYKLAPAGGGQGSVWP